MSLRRTALVFAPYLPTLGGGERVMLAIAERLARTHEVTLVAPRRPEAERWAALGFPDIPVVIGNARSVMRASRRYDLFVTQANTLPLPPRARRSILVVQFPFDRIVDASLLRRLVARVALRRSLVVTYSEFCRRAVQERWRHEAVELLAPPVRMFAFDPAGKDRSIVSVGRFISTGHAKRQDVLLDAWEALAPRLPEWRLHLVGGGRRGDPWVDAILDRAARLPRVTVTLDMDDLELAHVYRGADLYWHATGFGRPEDTPERAEHFGIAPLEAMSAGAVPLVYDDGGVAENVGAAGGVVWGTVDELVLATEALATDVGHRRAVQRLVAVSARRFAPEEFERRLDELTQS